MSRILYIAMPYDGGQSGISEYIRATVGALSKNHCLTLLALASDLPEIKACLKGTGHRTIPVSNYWGHPIANLFWYTSVLPFLTQRYHVDFVFLPAGNRRCLTFSAKPTVTTVHDLAPLRLWDKYDRSRQIYLRKLLPVLLRRCPQILAISSQTAKDLVELAGIKSASIAVAYNGYQKDRYHAEPQAQDLSIRLKLGITKPYVLYVARIEDPGKNHLGLLRAWQALTSEWQEKYALIFAGSDWNGSERVHDWIEKHQPPHVHFLGYVPEQDLPALYRGASLYVQPSLYEGFGIPLVEAMASGVPVISSDRGALPEVGGGAVVYINPDQPSDMAQKIEALLQDPEQQLVLKQLGLERAQAFSWQRHAETINILGSQAPEQRHKNKGKIQDD